MYADSKAVGLHGGGAIGAAIRAGRLDELTLNLVSVVLGSGKRPFEEGDLGPGRLELVGAESEDDVVHLHFRLPTDVRSG